MMPPDPAPARSPEGTLSPGSSHWDQEPTAKQCGAGGKQSCFDGVRCVRMSGCDEGAGVVWKPNYCLQGAPSELLARARPETSQKPEGGLFPGADGSSGETGLGQTVTFLGSLAGMWG